MVNSMKKSRIISQNQCEPKLTTLDSVAEMVTSDEMIFEMRFQLLGENHSKTGKGNLTDSSHMLSYRTRKRFL